MNLFSTITLLGAAQGVFIALIMFFLRKGNRRANLILGVLFLMIALALWNTYLMSSGMYRVWTLTLRWYDAVRLLTGPLVYLYVREMTVRPLIKSDIAHLIPALVNIAVLMPFFFADDAVKIAYVEHTLNGESREYIWFAAVRPWYNLAYLLLAMRLLQDYSRRIKEVFASLELVSLQWLWRIVLGMAIIVFLYGISSIGALFGLLRPLQANLYLSLIAALWVYGIAFFAITKSILHSEDLRQLLAFPLAESHDTFTDEEKSRTFVRASANVATVQKTIVQQTTVSVEEAAPNPSSFTLFSASFSKEAALIVSVMEQEKPYLDSRITLQQFGLVCNLSPQRVSDVLNKELGVNFFDFVNRYRVEEWKRRIIDSPPSVTIQEVAYAVGFNSKSSFYTAFKKFTGQTPSEFRAAPFG